MTHKTKTGFTKIVLGAALCAALAACGGGGDSTSGLSAGTDQLNQQAATQLTGTVVIGAALTSAPVTVIDATGKTATAMSGSNGTYNVSIVGLTTPVVITATDPSGSSGNLYSVVASLATTNGAPVTANVTPLTTAVAALLTSSGNPLTLTQSGGLTAVRPSTITAAVTTLDTVLAPILSANGLSSTSFDPIGGAFTPDQTGADAVIDSIAVTPSTMGAGLQIASLANPDTAFQLSQGAMASMTLQPAPQPANYLATLVGQLGQCVSGTSSACSTAIDAKYLNDGFSTMQTRHPVLFAAGSTVTAVRTVAFLPPNTLPNISNPSALVYFLYTGSNGAPNFASDIVQQLPNGNWDIVGNQEQYDLYIASFLGRVQFTDAADAGNGRYESGLNIQIPTSMTVNGTSIEIGSAWVQGPGLPASGMYMLGADSGLGPYLTFPLQAITAPPVLQSTSTPSWPDVGMSTQYKWSWALQSGGSNAFTPTTPDYASAPANVSGIQQYGVYTVALYDYAGNPIGSHQKVINIAPNAIAAASTTVPWQTLGNDVIANLLTPGGSDTSTVTSPTTPTATIDWTIPLATLAYPNAWVSINSQGPAVFANGVKTYQAQPYDVTTSATPTAVGTAYSTTVKGYVDQLTPAANASMETAIQVQLGWQAGGEYYTNSWQYSH